MKAKPTKDEDFEVINFPKDDEPITITINISAKEDIKKLMSWSEDDWKRNTRPIGKAGVVILEPSPSSDPAAILREGERSETELIAEFEKELNDILVDLHSDIITFHDALENGKQAARNLMTRTEQKTASAIFEDK